MRRRFLFALAFAVFSAALPAQPARLNEQRGVRWACGGIGSNGRDALAKMQSDSNLMLVFAAGEHGKYLAHVAVVLSDRRASALRSSSSPKARSACSHGGVPLSRAGVADCALRLVPLRSS